MAADFSWTPPLVVLALGAVGGAVVVAVRSRYKTQAAAPAPAHSAAADLQRRYDALIRRLAEGVPADERAAVELEAAKVLMLLESPEKAARAAAHADHHDHATEAPAAAAPSAPAKSTPAWVGFLYGLLTMATLGGLFYFASQGSTERAAGGSPTGGMGMGGGGSASESSPEGVPADAPSEAEVKALEDAVTKSPKDVAQRVELVRAYLQRRDLMKVFDQTQAILEIEPGQPHALTYQALVRVAMGQADQAEKMLIEAIGKNPGIEDAYIHLAIARIQQGNRKGAEAAIADGQKQFPQDKEQLASIFMQLTTAADAPPASGAPQNGAPPAAAPAAAANEVERSGASAVVVIDLPKGMSVPPSAMLFVIAREAGFETGPPVAVKRVPAANFPITVTLSEKDSMAGEALPGLIRIDARVDRDGDPLTKDPSDPVASEDNVRPGGGQTLLVLAPVKK